MMTDWILWFAALVLGLSAPLIGSTLTLLAAKFGIPMEQAGVFASVHSLGSALATVVMGYWLDRQYSHWVLWLGPVSLALGLFGLAGAPTFAWALGAMGLFGMGFGATLLMANVVLARLREKQATVALNILNLFFGLGGIISPLLAQWLQQLGQETGSYLIIGTCGVVLAILLRWVPSAQRESAAQAGESLPFGPFFLFLTLFFLYLGSEVGVRTWLIPQVLFTQPGDSAVAAWALSLFGVGILLGRALASWAARSLSMLWLIYSGLGVWLGGTVWLLLWPAPPFGALVAAMLMGLGCGPLFPTFLAFLQKHFPRAFGQASGWLIFAGNLGAIALPWAQGLWGQGHNGGFGLISLSLLLLGFVMVGLQRQLAAHG